jgi:hypothetical protein
VSDEEKTIGTWAVQTLVTGGGVDRNNEKTHILGKDE